MKIIRNKLLRCIELLVLGSILSSGLSLISPVPAEAAGKSVFLPVPFTAQAPLANWRDSRQQDGCEEAASVMAMAWVKGEGAKEKISKKEFEKRIIAVSDFEKKKYGEYRDIALPDVAAWIFKDYYKHDKVAVLTASSSAVIVKELEKGNIVLAPMNGRQLKNPYFTAPGPLTHMLLIKGYDSKTDEFITNDPGTRRGENYRYPAKIVMKALYAYPTGYHLPATAIKKEVLVVGK